MSLLLDEHREYLSDGFRVDALRRAIHATVRPGDTVLDLGCGTGLLGLMACEAGAAHVFAIDDSGMIEIARAIAAANGVADRITHISNHSLAAELPRRADVLVFDQIGRLGFDAGLLEFALDARRRLLVPDARIMPGPVHLEAALAVSPEVRSHIEFWSSRPAGIDASPARFTASNTGYPVEPEHVRLASSAARLMTFDTAGWEEEPLGGTATVTADSDADLDGIVGWFVAELAPGVTMTNAPGDARRIHRRAALLPFDRTLHLSAGDQVQIAVRILPADSIVAWEAVRARDGERRAHSTWGGMLAVAEQRARTRADAVPELTPRGTARRTVLELCDGRRTVTEIERDLRARHPELFRTDRDAAIFAAEVLAVYARA